MIRLISILILALNACSFQQTSHPSVAATILTTTDSPSTHAAETDRPPSPNATTPATPLPTQKKIQLTYHHTSRNGIVLSLVSFDDRDFQLQVADQTNGPATHWRDARTAANALRGVAAINGGFFTPEGKPLGLVITHGDRRGHINRSSLGAGIYLSNNHTSKIVRRNTYTQSPKHWGKITQLLQSGPMLAENNAPISGLSKNNSRPRSFIAWDGKHHWAIGYAESCTLHALSHALAGKAPADFAIHTAVNLDGGRSSDLWAGSKVANGQKTHRTFLNKPVRNFLVVVPK